MRFLHRNFGAFYLNHVKTEDWNSEKADVSLLEGIHLQRVLEMLQNAVTWLEISPESQFSGTYMD